MISTDMTNAGVSTVTSPAVGLRCSDRSEWTVAMAPYAAPQQGTGLSAAAFPAARLRGLTAATGARTTGARTTGAPFGTDHLLSVTTTALPGAALAGDPTSTTPGDLPPEDPLS